MDRSAAGLFWVVVFILLGVLLWNMDWTTRTATTKAVAPAQPVVINNPNTVVVSDRTTVSDTTPVETVPAQASTYYGEPVAVARTYPAGSGGCQGVCTTACPTVTVPGACPAGTICCR